LCLATTVILKMHPAAATTDGAAPVPGTKIQKARPALALVTLVPLLWLLAVTMTAGLEKIFHPDPNIGFLAAADKIAAKMPGLRGTFEEAQKNGDAAALAQAGEAWRSARGNHFNLILDAVVAAVFLAMVVSIAALSAREWILLVARRKAARLRETPPVWLPDYALAETTPFRVFNLLALAVLLLKELSGEAAADRAAKSGQACRRHEAHRQAEEKRFTGVNRCC
jgi:carbon starvation protein